VLRLALAAARATAFASRATGRGGGTTLPGRVLTALAPDAPRRLAGRLPRGCVLVSATNEFQGSASGIQVTQRVWCVLTVKSGQVTRSEAFIRPEHAVEAVAAWHSRPPTG